MSSYSKNNIIKMHGLDKDENEMNIYETGDPINRPGVRTETKNTRRQQTPYYAGSDSVKVRSSRRAPVCLVLLCFLLLTAVIVLSVYIYINHTTLKHLEKNELLKMDGWIYFKSSLYFISTEKKSWTHSRRYCTERGADLIIINNSDEQEFVKKISKSGKVWIGLTDKNDDGSWKYVDGSAVNAGFWGPREPNGGTGEDCALSDASWWADYPCESPYQWICEKNMNL